MASSRGKFGAGENRYPCLGSNCFLPQFCGVMLNIPPRGITGGNPEGTMLL